MFSIAGGKGGVGKSIFTISLGVKLAQQGHSVCLIDLDLGAANLHTYLGIIKKTPTIADFMLKRVSSLNELLIDTSQENLSFISGAEFVPGMANPAHSVKIKMVRHIKALPADVVIIDLGAGVHFNTLDFFNMSDRGVIVTAPEPGAVMNAYSFIKGALFRKLQNIFRKHPSIGPAIEAKTKNPDDEKKFSLEWLTEKFQSIAPDMLPMLKEIERDFSPALVVNRITGEQQDIIIYNLLSLCSTRLGISTEYVGNLPDAPDISKYLLNIPNFLAGNAGKTYFKSVEDIADKLVTFPLTAASGDNIKAVFSDDELDEITSFMEQLDDSIFSGTNRDTLKLRLFFKPAEVINFLISRGATHEVFYS